MKRIFAAIKINLDDGFLDIYEEIKETFYKDKIKWVAPENMHITLKFFGDTKEDIINNIRNTFRNIAGTIKPFEIKIKGFGFFGNSRFPRVLWFGIEFPDNLDLIYENIQKELEPLGYQSEDKKFKPHLTIGRIKDFKNKRLLLDLVEKYNNTLILRNQVKEFVLYESILKKEGPVYIPIEKFKL